MIARAATEFKPVRHLQKELMLSHREVAPQVFATAYANGETTVCNYAEQDVVYDGKTNPSAGYVIFKKEQ